MLLSSTTNMARELNVSKDNFSKWYDEVMHYADIIDDRYPIKGVGAWKPYGYKSLKLMIQRMENLLDATDHNESYFPLFVPASVFEKESDFLKGFQGEALRVTKIGRRTLDEELIVRPTSETAMYPMFSLWTRSWRDLPLKIYQTVPVFRWETKMTKPLLRVREITKFKEAHTVHATKSESDKQIQEAVKVYKEFFDDMLIPYIMLRVPAWDVFAGAEYNYDFFTIMPDGKAIELASVINLGQKMAKAFDIKYIASDEKEKHAWQTCYGISERTLGSTLAIHGDDTGLIFPSTLAPFQVVIVPIGTDKKVLAKAESIKNNLTGIRVHIDNTRKRPGEKFYNWEARGVPIRIEIGPRDLAKKKVTIARRDNGNKTTIAESRTSKYVSELLNQIDKSIYSKSRRTFRKQIHDAKTIAQAKKILETTGGIVRLPWNGNNKKGQEMEKKLVGQALGYERDKKHLYFARTY